MSETPSNDKPAKDFNKIDLAPLQSFSFGTQWAQDKADTSGHSGGGSREPRRDDRPRREGPGAGPGPSRDRRGLRKPAGPGEEGAVAPAGANTSAAAPRAPREGSFDSRGPRRDGPGGAPARGEFRGGPAGPRREDGPRFGGPREGGFPQRDQGPYISPLFNVTFYPDDTGFSALAKAIRSSCRTYELFEIARVIIGKNDRFIAVVQHKPAENASAAKPAPFAISVPDGVPFESEQAAINHVFEKHFAQFFDTAEVEIEAPKGNFQVVNRCSVTGELLGPPNYHRYNQIVQLHHAANIKLPFEVYRGKIESVREPEVIAQWLEKMKKTVRYTWKVAVAAAPVAPVAVADAELVEGADAPAAEPVVAAAVEVAASVSFDSLEDARQYLLATVKDKLVRTVESLRFSGKNLETLPAGEIRRTLEGALERQRRFPLDTANALRGRLRREGFTIFKKGSKGVSYVCAVKRKFRIPNQTFSDSIGALINFLEVNPMIKASDLADKFLGYSAPAKVAAPAEGEAAAPVAPALTAEQNAKLNRLNGDLRWLVSEGYVTEFIDGRLFAPAPVVESRKKEIEGAEHDPENFPEVPAAEAPASDEATS
ncbi:MAG: hypothetical protein H2172_13010 [Opitutus sp.]|nr:hypothetical protein [Opitutus sp.]MCS6247107.1 hypothetical protein [Opitutus sp.]MCS6273467.1 hypothetical protein [Opitutus sp.]MCS6275822.1 hypothetical protein [Opitutus sp.]MCS6300918.1 hypothetical protein [Opitutus sp.]